MKADTRSLAALVGVVLIGMTGFGIFLPIFPFLALKLHAAPAAAALAMGAYSLGQLVASPFWGRLSDRVGRKPILIAGLIGAAVSYLWIARAGSVVELGAARLFGGLMAGNIGAAFAAAADISDDKTRARNMGLLGAAVGLAFIAGPALGASIVGTRSGLNAFYQICIVSAAFAGLAALAALVFFRETLAKAWGDLETPVQQRMQVLSMRPLLPRLLIIMLLAVTAQAAMETTFALWADAELHWGPREVGWTLAALGFGSVVLQGGLAGKASRLVGERSTMTMGLLLLAFGLFGLGIAHAIAAVSASLTALVIGIGLATPALNALLAEQGGEHEHGAVMGLSQSASALGRVVGPLCASGAIEVFGIGAPFLAGALTCVAAFLVAIHVQTTHAGGSWKASRLWSLHTRRT